MLIRKMEGIVQKLEVKLEKWAGKVGLEGQNFLGRICFQQPALLQDLWKSNSVQPCLCTRLFWREEHQGEGVEAAFQESFVVPGKRWEMLEKSGEQSRTGLLQSLDRVAQGSLERETVGHTWLSLFLSGFVNFLTLGLFNKICSLKMDVWWSSNSPFICTSVDSD